MSNAGRKAVSHIFKLVARRYPTKKAFAQALGVNQQSMTDWKRTGVPMDHAIAVASLLDITPHDVRPDKFPKSLHYDAAS